MYTSTHLRLELLGVHGRELVFLVALALGFVLLELLRIVSYSYAHVSMTAGHIPTIVTCTHAPSSSAPCGTRPSG